MLVRLSNSFKIFNIVPRQLCWPGSEHKFGLIKCVFASVHQQDLNFLFVMQEIITQSFATYVVGFPLSFYAISNASFWAANNPFAFLNKSTSNYDVRTVFKKSFN